MVATPAAMLAARSAAMRAGAVRCSASVRATHREMWATATVRPAPGKMWCAAVMRAGAMRC